LLFHIVFTIWGWRFENLGPVPVCKHRRIHTITFAYTGEERTHFRILTACAPPDQTPWRTRPGSGRQKFSKSPDRCAFLSDLGSGGRPGLSRFRRRFLLCCSLGVQALCLASADDPPFRCIFVDFVPKFVEIFPNIKFRPWL
jgi:hypothetical protein